MKVKKYENINEIPNNVINVIPIVKCINEKVDDGKVIKRNEYEYLVIEEENMTKRQKEIKELIEENYIEGIIPFVEEFIIINEFVFSKFYKKVKKLIEDGYYIVKNKDYIIEGETKRYRLYFVKINEQKIEELS